MRQVLFDAATLAHVGLWVWMGYTLYRLIDELRVYGERMESAGAQFRETMAGIGEDLGGVWLIGDGIRIPFDQASNAGSTLEEAGISQQELVHQLALWTGIGITLVPIFTILVFWAIPRVTFAVRAGNARRMLADPHAQDLLALRALARQRLPRLAAIHEDPVGSWRRGDADVVRQLAALELKSSGVRPPEPPTEAPSPARPEITA